MPSVFERFPWKRDEKLAKEAEDLVSGQRLALYENWVIFRFGSDLAEMEDIDLVFRHGYPDAILLRTKEGEMVEELNIEFEENSSHFKDHKHDPEKCDLIVCAFHDWKKKVSK